MTYLPHSQPYFDAEDEACLRDVVQRRFVTSGKMAQSLGEKIAALIGKQWGVPTQSGTDAITTAMRILGASAGDRVAMPSYMCSAPLDSLSALGALPLPLDIDRTTLSICPTGLDAHVACRAVIVPHMFGIPANIQQIRHPRIIEDCAQTLGLTIGSRPIGSFGHLTICSFYGTKLLTTGHGGMILGNDRSQYQEVVELFQHDKQEHWSPHFHYQLSDLNAALGLSQLNKLPFFIQDRRRIALRYRAALGASTTVPNCIYSRFLLSAPDAEETIRYFQDRGVEAKRPVFKPISMLLNLPEELFPNTMWAHRHIVSIPLYPGMTEQQIASVESILTDIRSDAQCWPP